MNTVKLPKRWVKRKGRAYSVNRRRDYDILTALRGPDVQGEYAGRAKSMLTSVIRWFAGIPTNTMLPASVWNPASAVRWWQGCDPDQKEDVREFIKTNSHFRNHAVDALAALGGQARIYLAWLKQEVL
jgi:hypothetical protein